MVILLQAIICITIYLIFFISFRTMNFILFLKNELE